MAASTSKLPPTPMDDTETSETIVIQWFDAPAANVNIAGMRSVIPNDILETFEMRDPDL